MINKKSKTANGKYYTANRAFNCLFRTDFGDKLMLSEKFTNKICERVTYPSAQESK